MEERLFNQRSEIVSQVRFLLCSTSTASVALPLSERMHMPDRRTYIFAPDVPAVELPQQSLPRLVHNHFDGSRTNLVGR